MEREKYFMSKHLGKALLASCLLFTVSAVRSEEPVQELFRNDKADFRASEKLSARRDPKAYTIDPASIRITRLEAVEEKDLSYLGPVVSEVGGALVIIDQIINIASKVWNIIQQNAPVVNIDTQYAAAVPQGITAWNQLSEWKKPKSYIYGFRAKNLYGASTVDVKYKVIFTPDGKYKGKGRYLTGVTVVPTVVNVSWGYRFSLTAQVPDSTIINEGTDEDPIASLQLKIAWRISSAIKSTDGASVYYIRGDGGFEEIANPFARKEVKMEDVKSAVPLLLDPAGVF